MALIKCKECGHKVSDKAECCPNCGCPIEEIMSADASNDTNVSQVYDDAVQFDDIPPKKSKGWLWTIVVILVLAAIGVGVWLFTNGKLGEDDPTTAKVEITPEFIAAVHQYDELYPFSEGLAAVKKDGKFGYINTKGELVIPCQYQYAGSFKEGLACVVKDEEDNNISFIDAKGKMLHTKYPFNSYYYVWATGQTYIGSAISFTNGVCEIKYILGDNIGEEPQTVYIDRQMKEVAQPAEESTQSEENLGYEIFRVSDKDIYGEETSLVGVKDKDGEIVIPAKYYDLEICDNGVVLARMFIESAESRFYQDKIGYGLTVYGYIDFTGKSTFTDADMGKLEGYKEAEIPAMAQLKLEAEQEEREEQARLEEERRQMGTDFVVTMTADFNKYGEICNESSTIGHIIRFRDSFETKYYVVPKGKRMKYLYYREHNNNISIYDDLRIEIYDENNRNLVAQHNLRECGEFNILSGQRFGIKAHTIGCHSSNEYRDCHFNMEFVFKVFDE